MVWQIFSRNAVRWRSTFLPRSAHHDFTDPSSDPRGTAEATAILQRESPCTIHCVPTRSHGALAAETAAASRRFCTGSRVRPPALQILQCWVISKHPTLSMATSTHKPQKRSVWKNLCPSRDLKKSVEECSRRIRTATASASAGWQQECVSEIRDQNCSALRLSMDYSTKRRAPCSLHIRYTYFSQNSKKACGREEYIVA